MDINVLSLFDGMSCGQIALERAGIKVDNYFASEIDKYAIQITQKNYPETIQLGDVTDINTNELPKIDLLIGGSPCQGFSFAGKQLNFNDPRSRLFFEYVRLLKETNPAYFLLENVKMKREHQGIISDRLGVQPVLINSNLVSAQNRLRLYWANMPICEIKPKEIYLSNIVDFNAMRDYVNLSKIKKTWKTKNYLQYDLSGKGYKSQDQRAYHLGGRHGTLPSNSCATKVKVLFDSGQIGKLTPIECERLQTVPDNYTEGVSPTQRYKMIGNGWTVDVITHIFKGLLNENI